MPPPFVPIGTLLPLCWSFTETVVFIIGALSIAMVLPGIFATLAVLSGGHLLYNQPCHVSWQVPWPFFILGWILYYIVLGMAGWNNWFFHNRTCDVWIEAVIWFIWVFLSAIWIPVLFNLVSLILTAVIFFAAIMVGLLYIAWVSVDSFSVVTVILAVFCILWLLVIFIWVVLTWYFERDLWKRPPKEAFNKLYASFTGRFYQEAGIPQSQDDRNKKLSGGNPAAVNALVGRKGL